MEILPSAPDPSGTIKQILPTESAPIQPETAPAAPTPAITPAAPSVDSVSISPEAQSLQASSLAAQTAPAQATEPSAEPESGNTPSAANNGGSSDAIQAFQDIANGPEQAIVDAIA